MAQGIDRPTPDIPRSPHEFLVTGHRALSLALLNTKRPSCKRRTVSAASYDHHPASLVPVRKTRPRARVLEVLGTEAEVKPLDPCLVLCSSDVAWSVWNLLRIYGAVKTTEPPKATLTVQIDDTEARSIVRPVFAAWVFGFLAVLFVLGATVAFAQFLRTPGLSWLAWSASILAPCAPLTYFAARGFREGRRGAFDELPESACLAAALFFIALAALLRFAAGTWGAAVGPGVAAVLFAVGVRPVRELLFLLP